MAAQYVVVALKVENIHSGWLSSGKLVAPKEDNIHIMNYKLFQGISLSMLGTRNMRLMVFLWMSVLSSYCSVYWFILHY